MSGIRLVRSASQNLEIQDPHNLHSFFVVQRADVPELIQKLRDLYCFACFTPLDGKQCHCENDE